MMEKKKQLLESLKLKYQNQLENFKGLSGSNRSAALEELSEINIQISDIIKETGRLS